MAKWADEFRQGWRGIAQPSLLMGAGFAAICLALLITSFVTQNAARDVPSPYVQVAAAHSLTSK